VKKIGQLSGMDIYVDPKLRPNEARMVSFVWDPMEQRMRQLDNVRVVNLKV
jgi:hypothetical protein